MRPGEVVSEKYRLLFRLGEGGMAEVWAAQNLLTHREFAIKFILPALAGRKDAVERFFQEAKAAGRLRHPCIVDVFDVGLTPDGRPYLVMELLRGESLESRLARDERLEPLEACIVFAELARALSLAHRAGVVHRDLSTANVFLCTGRDGAQGTPKILDFGVSKIVSPELESRVRTGDGAALGSPAYMSPEQACGAENVDARSDVWSLGVLLYESLGGRPPFRAANYNALMMTITSVAHEPLAELCPELDAGLARAVESCLVKDREARTQSALDLAVELERAARRLCPGGRALRAPGRRATDRIPASEPDRRVPLARGAVLPARAYPLGVRLWRRIAGRTPPGGLALGGALVGTTLGLAIGVAVAGASPNETATLQAPLPKASAAAPAAAAASARVPEKKNAHDEERDLVRATARGLGLPMPGTGPQVASRHSANDD